MIPKHCLSSHSQVSVGAPCSATPACLRAAPCSVAPSAIVPLLVRVNAVRDVDLVSTLTEALPTLALTVLRHLIPSELRRLVFS